MARVAALRSCTDSKSGPPRLRNWPLTLVELRGFEPLTPSMRTGRSVARNCRRLSAPFRVCRRLAAPTPLPDRTAAKASSPGVSMKSRGLRQAWLLRDEAADLRGSTSVVLPVPRLTHLWPYRAVPVAVRAPMPAERDLAASAHVGSGSAFLTRAKPPFGAAFRARMYRLGSMPTWLICAPDYPVAVAA